MKKILLSLLALITATACSKAQVDEASSLREALPKVLTASFEENDTRIQLQAGKTIWTEGDHISVFYKSFDNLEWEFQGSTGDRTGEFRMVEGTIGAQVMNDIIVAYPYDTSYRIDSEDKSLDAYIPATQHYLQDSYGLGENLMVANCEFTQFALKNVCGWLKIQLTGDGQRVTKLTLRGNNDEQIAGLIHVDTKDATSILASESGDSGDDTEVGGNLIFDNSIITEQRLNCGEGIELSGEVTSFIFALPPQNFTNGITVEVECAEHKAMTISTTNPISITRNHITPMATVEYEKESDTLSPYESQAPFVCTMDNSNNCVYSLGSTAIFEQEVSGFKLGTSSKSGVTTSQAIETSGDKYLNFYAVAWKDRSATLYIKVDNGAVISQELVSNNGASGNPPFSALTFADSDHYSIKLTGLKNTSTISFSTSQYFTTEASNNARAVVCGIKLSNTPIDNITDSGSGGGNEDSGDQETESATASDSWLELPAIREDNAYPDGYEYTLTVDGERNYTHYYDSSTYTSMWVAYPLSSTHIGSLSRPTSWSYNPLISISNQINLCKSSYNNSYSRGHLIPNGSRNNDSEMQAQTFYVTNSVPQVQDGFNGGVWNNLEGAVRSIVSGSSEEIYVVTGVAFRKSGGNESISYTTAKDDSRNIPIPNYFYKVILRVKKSGSTVTNASTIGFWFENKAYSDSYTNHTVSVDTIEEWTGFNFFVNLPDSIEQAAEKNANWSTFSSF